MNKKLELPVKFTDIAANQVKSLLINKKANNFKLRVYITGGGCSGFQYKFILDNNINIDDFVFEKQGVFLVVDSISLQYLKGGIIDYHESLAGSSFIVTNPNAKTTCSCGLSFSI